MNVVEVKIVIIFNLKEILFSLKIDIFLVLLESQIFHSNFDKILS